MKKNPFVNCPMQSQNGQAQNRKCTGASETLSTSVEEVLLRAPGEKSNNPVNFERETALEALYETTEQNLEELKGLTDRTGMPVTQENGQRRYGPPLDTVSVPPRGSEVFVGRLPRNCFEAEIVPVFERIGRIYELRLMMDFSGTNRGYCFVHYFSPADADRAVRDLNNFEIRPGRHIGVVKSVDNCRLFIGGIPKNKTENEIRKEVDKITEGVVRVIVYSSLENPAFNRGFAFVEYENHKTAAMARRKLVPGKLLMWGAEIAVDWAEPEPEVDVLFVRNINANITEQWLCEEFNLVSDNGVKTVKKVRDFAFVHFYSHSQAGMAKIAMENAGDSSSIQVHWAKSTDKSKDFHRKGNKIRFEFNLNNSTEPSKVHAHQGKFQQGYKPSSNDMMTQQQRQPTNTIPWYNNKPRFQIGNNGFTLFSNETIGNKQNGALWQHKTMPMSNSYAGYQNPNAYTESSTANYMTNAGLYNYGLNYNVWSPTNQNQGNWQQQYNGGNFCNGYY